MEGVDQSQRHYEQKHCHLTYCLQPLEKRKKKKKTKVK